MRLCNKRNKIPRIELFKVDRNNLRRIERKFYCTYFSCKYKCRTYRQVDIHFYDKHTCKKCMRRFALLNRHKCKLAGSVIGLGKHIHHASQAGLPLNFVTGKFSIVHSVHGGVICQLYEEYHPKLSLKRWMEPLITQSRT